MLINDDEINNEVMSTQLSEVNVEPTCQEMMNKNSSELSAEDIFKIVQLANRELNVKIDELRNDVNVKVRNLQNRVEILESVNTQKDEEINTLKYIVVNMQKCLNKMDCVNRELNVIISDLPEKDMCFIRK